ncbi:hypothetical protein HID58_070062 [Brassica napus]|uniref:Uncharacterized protein n=1 Tax=Brassica napus TaxID=3708 RepID=A0ABQ7YXR5_BRANA|nr:hypothetical protein HID58_070062 [Brassica napus]
MAEENSIAEDISRSVTRDKRYQSYIAQGRPSWVEDDLNNLAVHKITNITQSERESRSKIGSGERSARERACRRRSPSSNRKDVGFSLLFRLLCLPPCLSSRSGPIRGCFWSKGAVVWRLGAVKLVVLPVEVSFPGGGGSYSSVAAGPCLREVEAFSVPPSSVLSPEGEGSLSLASPFVGSVLDPACGLCVVLGSWFQVVHGFVQSDELSIGSMKLSKVKTKRGSVEMVLMEALR